MQVIVELNKCQHLRPQGFKASWRKPHSCHLPLRKELPKLKLNGFARVVDTLAKSNDSVPAQRLAAVLLFSKGHHLKAMQKCLRLERS